MGKIIIKGITWGHSRGISPLLAFSQRFSELNPEVEVQWTKRSLQEFADFPIEKLTEQYDLLIIDHPWVGCAAATNCVLPLEGYLTKEYLQDQLDNSVGQSHQSYNYNGHQWALAIDAATPAASYRPDLFEKNNFLLPVVWKDLIALASNGKVAVPGIPIDLLMNFYMFCIASGSVPFLNEQEVVNLESGKAALLLMKELYSLVDKKMFQLNPIGVAELMTSSDDYWYCPFAYCYSNYSREGFSDKKLKYADMVCINNQRLKSTIGGTGLSVSAFSQHKSIALEYLTSIVSPKCQSAFYVENGGQSGHKSAWLSQKNNLLCNEFFSTLLPVMENGFIRPRYYGYLFFQDHAGILIQDFILNKRVIENVLYEINKLYIKSLSFIKK
ncbi:MAG: carbohydrate ABC transporter substrate-binding protein [Bacteroidetes bacterium]|nr:carbohydrate ABC transporter substrate-binding protein [Bacteroidota bacterium]